jgi:hypothetical protein
VAAGSTQSLTEMSSCSLPGVKVCRHIWLTGSLPSVISFSKMWEPPLTSVWASMACYKNRFTFTLYVGFDILIAVVMKNPLFKDKMLCYLVKDNPHFR